MRVHTAILLSVLMAAVLTPQPVPAADEIGGQDRASLLRQARELERQKHYEVALRLYREAEILDASDLGPRVSQARIYVALDRLGDAEAALRPVLLLEEPGAEALALQGTVLYRTERLGQAREFLEASLEERENPAVRNTLADVKRELAFTGEYRDALSSHFILRYEGEERSDQEPELLRLLEQEFQSLRRQFGDEPDAAIVVVLYPREEFHEATLAPSRAIGLYDGKVRIPSRGINLSNAQFRGTLTHELAHAFIHSLGGERVPRWLHEGLAEYLESEWLGKKEKQFAKEFLRERDGSWGRQFSYPRAHSLVKYMVERGGLSGMTLLLDELRSGKSMDDALTRVYGRTYAELTREWGEELVERNL